jgi:hypothetical protein
MTLEGASVLITIPAFRGQVSSETLISVTDLCIELTRKGIDVSLRTFYSADIALVRNVMTTIWYDETEYTHLLMIDDDMQFTPELVLDMLYLDQPLVGVIAPMRQENGFAGDPGRTGDPSDWPTISDGKFLEVDHVGAGILLIRRDVIKGILEKFPWLSHTGVHQHSPYLAEHGISRVIRCFDQQEGINNRGRTPEDISFCWRYRSTGGKVYASISHAIGHIGKKLYCRSYLNDYKSKQQTTN